MAARNLILAALCAILTTPAIAGVPLLPPAEYDHEPTQRLEVMRLHPSQVYGACKPFFPRALRLDVNGCAIREPGVCLVIVIDRPTSRGTPEQVFRHERAHCNGWAHR